MICEHAKPPKTHESCRTSIPGGETLQVSSISTKGLSQSLLDLWLP